MSAILTSLFATHYRLENFSHLFDVSFGVNLAYTLLDDLRSYGKKGYDAAVQEGMEQCKSVEPSADGLIGFFAHRCKKASKFMDGFSENIIGRMRPWAFISALIIIVLLGWIGFAPDQEIPLACIMMIIAFLVAPVPVALFVMYTGWHLCTHLIKRTLNNNRIDIQEMKEQAANTLMQPTR